MKSFCIKTNNREIINYLLNKFDKIDFANISYIDRKFKIYNNFIVHYTGENLEEFYKILGNIITDTIIKFYEIHIIRRILGFNYFYFDEFERNKIEEVCIESLKNNKFKNRNKTICNKIQKYLKKNKSMILDGFVTFRIKEYIEKIDELVDEGVNKYIVEKEYAEFISLLKMYVNSKEPETEEIHLIYTNGESILLDKNKDIITIANNSFNAKYLSDITFSSNDFALNTLLSLLPKKINVHLITKKDEFIDTLCLIFEEKVYMCTDCNICRTYKIINSAK
ncbi:MAG: putative sporulation protein YtxC [Clostridia bacterium]|nr:putative sporulation protein YtxC [Clostridia bacterium]